MKQQMGNWAELIEDLLVCIAKRISVVEDFVSFGGVCRSWRSVAVKENFKGGQQIPWLMLSEEIGEENGSDERRFVSLTKGGMIRKWMLPEARGKRCFESLGWFVTVSEDGEMNLLHPLSRVEIGLPHIKTFKNYIEDMMKNNFIFIQKAVLSSTPDSSGNDYVLMVIHGYCGWMGFWRPGDKAWTCVETRIGRFQDILYHKRQLYGVDAGGNLFACDIWGLNQTVAQLVVTIPGEFVASNRSYIVESEGALLIVVRDGCDIDFLGDYGDDSASEDELDESRIDYGVEEFVILEVDLSNGGGWSEKKSLGTHSLFLGDNASISVEAWKFPGIKANCIYYTDDCWETHLSFKRGGGKDMGIYSLEDGSRMPYYKGEYFSRICPPIWVNPSF